MSAATTLPPPAGAVSPPRIEETSRGPDLRFVESVVPRDGEDITYEVVNGQRVELKPMGQFETGIASLLDQQMGPYTRAQNLGRVRIETLFRLDPATELDRRPDLAFVSFKRWPKNRRLPRTNAAFIVPDLAVEVVSPTDIANAVLAKVLEYFHYGVEQVWLVWPDARQVYVYTSPTLICVFTEAEELDGGTLLPGFRMPVAALFEDAPEEEPAPSVHP